MVFLNIGVLPKKMSSRQALIVQGNSVVGAAVAYAMDLVYTVRRVRSNWGAVDGGSGYGKIAIVIHFVSGKLY